MKLQTRCEQLGVELRGRLRECEAYGNVVERRLTGMQIAGVRTAPVPESAAMMMARPGAARARIAHHGADR